MKHYPINLDLTGARVLVIGGGRVALRKVETLLSCGADVTVVSPEFCPELEAMPGIRRVARGYRKTDVRGVRLVIAAAGVKAVNRRAWEHASAAGIPINVADDPALCDFTIPATLERGDILVTVSTGGGSPALARQLRDRIADAIGDEFVHHLALLREMRERVKDSGLPLDTRSALLRGMADPTVAEMIRRDGIDAVRSILESRLAAALREA